MMLEVCWDGLCTLSFGLSQFHGHGSWLVSEVALIRHNSAVVAAAAHWVGMQQECEFDRQDETVDLCTYHKPCGYQANYKKWGSSNANAVSVSRCGCMRMKHSRALPTKHATVLLIVSRFVIYLLAAHQAS